MEQRLLPGEIGAENEKNIVLSFVKTEKHRSSKLDFGNMFSQFNLSSTKEQDKPQFTTISASDFKEIS